VAVPPAQQWILSIDDPPAGAAESAPLDPCVGPWIVLGPPTGGGAQLSGALAHEEIDLCFGDVLCAARGAPPLFAIRPPENDRTA
jgi:hypothetical protein